MYIDDFAQKSRIWDATQPSQGVRVQTHIPEQIQKIIDFIFSPFNFCTFC